MSNTSWARAARAVRLIVLAGGVCALLPTGLTLGSESSKSVNATAARHTIGHASWYGREFANRPMASGKPFDPEKLTAAHRKLPLGTKVVVTNLHNGRSVLVTITDRGPYWGNRVIDLSHRAARVIGMERRGVARVRIEPL